MYTENSLRFNGSSLQGSYGCACCVVRNMFIRCTIQSFRHKGLRKFFESGSAAGIQPHHSKRLRMLLVALDTALSIEDTDVPGFRLHSLKGSERGRWSVWITGNWRVTFTCKDGHAYVLDYEDYH